MREISLAWFGDHTTHAYSRAGLSTHFNRVSMGPVALVLKVHKIQFAKLEAFFTMVRMCKSDFISGENSTYKSFTELDSLMSSSFERKVALRP